MPLQSIWEPAYIRGKGTSVTDQDVIYILVSDGKETQSVKFLGLENVNKHVHADRFEA